VFNTLSHPAVMSKISNLRAIDRYSNRYSSRLEKRKCVINFRRNSGALVNAFVESLPANYLDG
jgi:hypothetical protein